MNERFAFEGLGKEPKTFKAFVIILHVLFALSTILAIAAAILGEWRGALIPLAVDFAFLVILKRAPRMYSNQENFVELRDDGLVVRGCDAIFTVVLFASYASITAVIPDASHSERQARRWSRAASALQQPHVDVSADGFTCRWGWLPYRYPDKTVHLHLVDPEDFVMKLGKRVAGSGFATAIA